MKMQKKKKKKKKKKISIYLSIYPSIYPSIYVKKTYLARNERTRRNQGQEGQEERLLK